MVLDASSRAVVEQTICEVANHCGWQIRMLSVQTNHVHVVVNAQTAPEKAMSDFKACSTRRLRESQLLPPNVNVWC